MRYRPGLLDACCFAEINLGDFVLHARFFYKPIDHKTFFKASGVLTATTLMSRTLD